MEVKFVYCTRKTYKINTMDWIIFLRKIDRKTRRYHIQNNDVIRNQFKIEPITNKVFKAQ